MNHSISTMSGKTKVKMVFLGNQSVGKSSIIEKYIHDHFDEKSNPTVGIDFLAKNVSHAGKNYRIQLWDTAGQERFRSLIPSYLKDAHCALIVYDVTCASSMDNISMWLSLYNDNRIGNGRAFLVGNKIDVGRREISQQAGQEKAKELGLDYYEISAKTGINIGELFRKLLEAATWVLSGTSRTVPKSDAKASVIKQIKEEKEEDAQVSKNKEEIDESTKKMADKIETEVNISENKNQETPQNKTITLKASESKQPDSKSTQRTCC